MVRGSPLQKMNVGDSTPCNLVYVDVGSNVGDSIEDFVSGSKTMREVRMAVNAARGMVHGHNRTDYLSRTCVYAFEPNPRFTGPLRSVSQRSASKLSSIHIHYETAAIGTQEQQVELRFKSGDPRATGTSVGTAGGGKGTIVKAVNLVDFLRGVVALRHPAVPVVLRLDIEGAEYAVLNDAVTRGLAASVRNPYFLVVEWHRYRKKEWPHKRLAALSRHDAWHEGFNSAAAWRLYCLARPRPWTGNCKEWFDAAPSDEGALAHSRENARGMTSLYENYEKMIIHLCAIAARFSPSLARARHGLPPLPRSPPPPLPPRA
jgi:FkbM family methyltransferase